MLLPVDPDGISRASQALLADAKAKGVKIPSANLMVMYFGKKFINKGESEGQLGINSAKKAYEQIQSIDPAIQIGLCPCLGNNGSKDEVFTIDDAKTLRAFADETPWVCSLHYWSINGGSGRPSWRRPASAVTSTNIAGVTTTNNSPTAIPPGMPQASTANWENSFPAAIRSFLAAGYGKRTR